MNKVVPIVAALAGATVLATPAWAMTITNRDASAYTLLIQDGEQEIEQVLEAGAQFNAPCEEGCVIRVDGFEEELAANAEDSVMIKDGKLQSDSEG